MLGAQSERPSRNAARYRVMGEPQLDLLSTRWNDGASLLAIGQESLIPRARMARRPGDALARPTGLASPDLVGIPDRDASGIRAWSLRLRSRADKYCGCET